MTHIGQQLGYDPRPSVKAWRGTPIPPVLSPIPVTPRRERIARYVWWNGPPWTVLRNGPTYLWHVMDYARDADIRLMLDDIEPERWREALTLATPGALSKGAYVLNSLRFGLMGPRDKCDWPHSAHRNDVRPLRGQSRERLYARHARWREIKRRSATPPHEVAAIVNRKAQERLDEPHTDTAARAL